MAKPQCRYPLHPEKSVAATDNHKSSRPSVVQCSSAPRSIQEELEQFNQVAQRVIWSKTVSPSGKRSVEDQKLQFQSASQWQNQSYAIKKT